MDDDPGHDEYDEYDDVDREDADDQYEDVDDDNADDDDDADDYDEYDEYDDGDAYVAGPRLGSAPAFLLGILAGMLALGVVWSFVWLTGSNSAEAGTPRHRAADDATVLGTQQTQQTQPTRAAGPSRQARCRTVWAAQAPALRTAAATLDQWQVHVGAMNKLVVGEISLQQANAFWNQTRVGATRRLVAFLAADQRAEDAAADCPRAWGATSSPALRECAAAVAGRARTLQAARVAARTWQHHVRDMEMLRAGHLTPAQATEMWLASWHEGVRELRAYARADRSSSGRRC